jgi:GPH family glycoside/pentoside/hexuronide:cation symporter
MLSLAAFPSGVAPGKVDPASITVLVELYCIVVLVLGLVSAFWLARFPISREDHEERLAKLAEIDRAGGGAEAGSRQV